MNQIQQYRFKPISEYHRKAGLPRAYHPLISLVNMKYRKLRVFDGKFSMIFDFYCH